MDSPAHHASAQRTSPEPALPRHRAHKFGGSSVADADRYHHVATLMKDAAQPRAVVVSAMQGVTDALTALAESAAAGRDWQDAWSTLRDRHLATAYRLDGADRHALVPWLDAECAALSALLSRVAEDGTLSAHDFAAVQGLGEVWSSRLLQAALGGEDAGWARLDAREVLVAHPGELGVAVDWPRTRERFAAWRARHPQADVVITGFVARDADGRPTTLGRNGSDYSGAIFAVLFEAEDLTIWTDVDGVLSADPRLVPDAVCLPSMSYAEACELAYFGAKVLHPQTMAPAMQARLPILIRNSRNPDAPGTRIADEAQAMGASPVKGLSLVRDMALLELTGAGLIGVPGTAERMFAALHAAGVSVTVISQGSSEHSICCVVPAAHAQRARDAVRKAFAEAIADGQVEGVDATPGIAVLAAVGDGMVGMPGVSARLFEGLARARVNIRAIAQGASERNISVAIADADAVRGLRAVHSAFWLSPATLSVGLIGPGNVGRALLAQLADALPRFADEPRIEHRLDLRLRAVASSKRMLLDNGRLDPAVAVDALAGGEAPAVEQLDLDRFAAHVRAEHLPHALIVDCSGSDAVAARYPEWLAMGIHVVTPSKHAGSGDWARYRAIREAETRGGLFRYEATVGAGLPVIQTLRSLLDTGDALTGIEGVLSGTLAWLFNRYDGSMPFSELVAEAKALGYTEPDPRDDLSGTDVARKLVILAREAGASLSLSDIEIESLVPAALQQVSRDEFLARLSELDAPMQARLDAARAQGRGLRYLAQLGADGKARVGLAMPEPGHASLSSRLTDNLIQFRTRRYAHNPLVVQGPGAGADVTAAGVFGDILAIAGTLGARPFGAHA
jgi:aspartokinase/homoserine dehydrogenase 1